MKGDSVVRIFGNVGKIEAQYTPKGTYVLKGTIAVNHGKDKSKFTNWYNFVAWEKTGEFMNQMCKVGTWVFVEGELIWREWNDKEGVTHVSHDLTVSNFKVLGRGRGKDEEDQSTPYDETEPEYLQEG